MKIEKPSICYIKERKKKKKRMKIEKISTYKDQKRNLHGRKTYLSLFELKNVDKKFLSITIYK